MSQRFVPISPDMLQRSDLEAEAILLYEFLVDNQTSADGLVFYGKAIGYAWIRSRYLRGSLRSLQRYMRDLKRAGFVQVQREFHGGIRIRLPRSVKFAKPQAPPAIQLSLFSPEPTSIRERRAVDKPVEKQLKGSEYPKNNTVTGGGIAASRVAVERSEEQVKEKIRTLAGAHVLPGTRKTKKELDDRIRLLREQARMLENRKVKSS